MTDFLYFLTSFHNLNIIFYIKNNLVSRGSTLREASLFTVHDLNMNRRGKFHQSQNAISIN